MPRSRFQWNLAPLLSRILGQSPFQVGIPYQVLMKITAIWYIIQVLLELPKLLVIFCYLTNHIKTEWFNLTMISWCSQFCELVIWAVLPLILPKIICEAIIYPMVSLRWEFPRQPYLHTRKLVQLLAVISVYSKIFL